MTGIGAALLLLVAGALGAAVDLLLGPTLGIATTVLLPIGALLSTLLVRRTALFWLVIAPPLAYLTLVVGSLAITGRLSATGVAAEVVYGFPAMVVATLIAAVVAGLRQATGR